MTVTVTTRGDRVNVALEHRVGNSPLRYLTVSSNGDTVSVDCLNNRGQFMRAHKLTFHAGDLPDLIRALQMVQARRTE